MIVMRSNEESSQSEDEERASLYLMAKGDLKEEKDESFEEVTLEHRLTFIKECLAQGLLNCLRYESIYLRLNPLQGLSKS